MEINIIIMDSFHTPSHYNGSSQKKLLSPTTAHSKQSSRYHTSAASLMSGVRSEINNLIAEAQDKRQLSNLAFSSVHQTNKELIVELDPHQNFRAEDSYRNFRSDEPQRNLALENQQLRRELNEALREIMRLNKIIVQL